MMETSARLLRLPSLLQARPDWRGSELADRLGVTTRTVRNDVDRLRGFCYTVHASPGVGGGYRLGAVLPPLLLLDDEAIAVAVGLLTGPGPTVDPEVLTAIASACRDDERLRVDYRDHDGVASLRIVEPHRLVCWGRRCYLIVWDTQRQDWRSFRVDRIQLRMPTGPRFQPRDPPDGDVTAFVTRNVGSATWRHRVSVRLNAPAEVVCREAAVHARPGAGPRRNMCLLNAGSDSPHMLAVHLGMFDVNVEITDRPDLIAAFRELADRHRRATGAERLNISPPDSCHRLHGEGSRSWPREPASGQEI